MSGPAAALTEDDARALDQADPLAPYREQFRIPWRADGSPWVYFVGNSLGLMPRAVPDAVRQELDDWARLGVEGHFEAAVPWYSYHEVFRAPGARLVGAEPDEVVMMNSLTVNLHLMLATFYRPEGRRRAIAMEANAFPSDTYAVESHLRQRGEDPAACLLTIQPRPGELTLREDDIADWIERRGAEVAVLLLSGVQFYTGQLFDIARITAAAHRQGCLVGWDLAHAAGNVPLALHDWDVDFAVWCSYKYLNAGPGAIAGCFVHQRHGHNLELPRLAGWWGNDPETRFRMHENEHFVPRPGADGWQVSNPPILAMAPLRISLGMFDAVGMAALRRKSEQLTGVLARALQGLAPDQLEVLTPGEPERRGAQLSLRIPHRARAVFAALQAQGIMGDYRHPDVIRLAPVPLYNTFHEAWRAGNVVRQVLGQSVP